MLPLRKWCSKKWKKLSKIAIWPSFKTLMMWWVPKIAPPSLAWGNCFKSSPLKILMKLRSKKSVNFMKIWCRCMMKHLKLTTPAFRVSNLTLMCFKINYLKQVHYLSPSIKLLMWHTPPKTTIQMLSSIPFQLFQSTVQRNTQNRPPSLRTTVEQFMLL